MQCPKCGQTVFEFTTLCVYCGTAIDGGTSAADSSVDSSKNSSTLHAPQPPAIEPVSEELFKRNPDVVDLDNEEPVIPEPQPPAAEFESEPEDDDLFLLISDTVDSVENEQVKTGEFSGAEPEPVSEELFKRNPDVVDLDNEEPVIPEPQPPAAEFESEPEDDDLFLLISDTVDSVENEQVKTGEFSGAEPEPVSEELFKRNPDVVDLDNEEPVIPEPQPPAAEFESEPEDDDLFLLISDTVDSVENEQVKTGEFSGTEPEPVIESLFRLNPDAADTVENEPVKSEPQPPAAEFEPVSDELFNLDPAALEAVNNDLGPSIQQTSVVEPENEPEDGVEPELGAEAFEHDMFILGRQFEPGIDGEETGTSESDADLGTDSIGKQELQSPAVDPEPLGEDLFKIDPAAFEAVKDEPVMPELQPPAVELEVEPEEGLRLEPDVFAAGKKDMVTPAKQAPATSPDTAKAEGGRPEKEAVSLEKTVAMLAKMKGLLENGRFDANVYERMVLDSTKDYLATLKDETRLIFVSYEIGDSVLAPFLTEEMIENLKLSVMDDISEK